jgi:transcriptional regulator with XRE-family HTH domain
MLPMESLRERLSRRLRDLMRNNVTLNTQVKVSQRAGVSQSTVQRILVLDQAATVDVLEQLAAAFGIKQARYILLDQDEIDLLSQWARLSDEDRHAVSGFIAVTVQRPKRETAPVMGFTSTKPVPPELRAASARAAEKPIRRDRKHAAPKPIRRKA